MEGIRIKTREQKWAFDELQEAAMPLIEMLRLKGDPHTTAIVTQRGVEIVATEVFAPVPYED